MAARLDALAGQQLRRHCTQAQGVERSCREAPSSEEVKSGRCASQSDSHMLALLRRADSVVTGKYINSRNTGLHR